jgi:chemotaxis protein methyltransferase CheR
MTVREALRDPSDCRILATDVSTRALAAARQGQYREVDIERVPGHLRARYFSRERRNGTTVYQVSPELASMIQFGRINLATPPFPLKGPLDVVFCRNVMIYFDNPVRKRLLDEMSRLLRRGGYLMVGHSESLSGMLSDLKSVQPATYRKP